MWRLSWTRRRRWWKRFAGRWRRWWLWLLFRPKVGLTGGGCLLIGHNCILGRGPACILGRGFACHICRNREVGRLRYLAFQYIDNLTFRVLDSNKLPWKMLEVLFHLHLENYSPIVVIWYCEDLLVTILACRLSYRLLFRTSRRYFSTP